MSPELFSIFGQPNNHSSVSFSDGSQLTSLNCVVLAGLMSTAVFLFRTGFGLTATAGLRGRAFVCGYIWNRYQAPYGATAATNAGGFILLRMRGHPEFGNPAAFLAFVFVNWH
jgi:hypothetical protein